MSAPAVIMPRRPPSKLLAHPNDSKSLTFDAIQQNRHPYNSQGYLPNGATGNHPTMPAPGATPLLPNQGRVIQTGPIRVLCIADVRGMELRCSLSLSFAPAEYLH